MKMYLYVVFLGLVLLSGCAQTKYGSYQISTTPPGAKITSPGGFDYGQSPTTNWTSWDKSDGTWKQFVAKLDGFQDTSQEVWIPFKYSTRELALTDVKKISINLKTFFYGAYKIITEPSGAHISFTNDNKYMGSSPTSVWWSWNSDGSDFTKRVRIEKQGYVTQEKTFTVKAKYNSGEEAKKDPMSVFVLLQPANSASGTTNSIKITSDPTGASVYGNQNFWGITPIEIPVYFVNSSSQVEIRFEKTGFGAERRVLTISDRQIHVVLHRQ